METALPKIYGAICNVMGEIGPVSKDRTNKDQGYKFRGIDDVYNALQPAFVKHRVFVVPHVVECIRENRTSSKGTAMISTTMKMLYTFYAEDGSSVTADVVGEGMDTSDKSTGKALSMAYKYAMFQVLSIPTEDESPDNDNDSHPIAQPSAPPQRPVDMITEEQIKILSEGYKGPVLDKLLANHGIKSLNEMRYDAAAKTIKAYTDYIAKKNAVPRANP